jgi:CRISPR system Cascade subunit CasC
MTSDTSFDPFIQLHLLTFYPPANLNRDDQGRPKTATVGGFERQRVSSQALKRAFRTSDVFAKALDGHLASRTQRIGQLVQDHLIEKGIPSDKAFAVARDIASIFGKVKPTTDASPSTGTEQLAFISPQERASALALAEARAAGTNVADLKDLPSEVLLARDKAADIAMFGRMLADNPAFNRDASVAVAHAITTHRVIIEDDYYTAVDDLKKSSEDAGAGFIGEAAFGSGVFYLYIVIDRRLLLDNLGDDRTLAKKAIGALVEAAATVGPRGKINSYASHARASYMLAESGSAAPRTLASAFALPVDRHAPRPNDLLGASIKALTETYANFARAYPADTTNSRTMDVPGKTGSLDEIIAFAVAGL